MKTYAALLSGVAVVALAAGIGLVLPADTLALGSGVVLGALTSIPLSMLIGAMLSAPGPALAAPQNMAPLPAAVQPPYPRLDGYPGVHNFPPVVIINPATYQTHRQPIAAGVAPAFPLLEAQRQFQVIGDAGST